MKNKIKEAAAYLITLAIIGVFGIVVYDEGFQDGWGRGYDFASRYNRRIGG